LDRESAASPSLCNDRASGFDGTADKSIGRMQEGVCVADERDGGTAEERSDNGLS
jgi:hypothetical protein